MLILSTDSALSSGLLLALIVIHLFESVVPSYAVRKFTET